MYEHRGYAVHGWFCWRSLLFWASHTDGIAMNVGFKQFPDCVWPDIGVQQNRLHIRRLGTGIVGKALDCRHTGHAQ